MNLSNRQKLVESAIVSAIGIIFGVSTTYIPMLGLVVLLMPTPYIIITARCGIRYGFMSIFISSIIMFLLIDPLTAITLSVLFLLQGVL